MSDRRPSKATALGDVKAALAGRVFGTGDNGTALSTSAAGYAPDCASGENFYLTLGAFTSTATSVITTPVNYEDGSRMRLIINCGNHTMPKVTLAAIYLNAPFTVTKNRYKIITFSYVAALGKFVQDGAQSSYALA